MSAIEPRSVLLAPSPITGLARVDCLAMLAGPMPRRRCGLLRMGFLRDVKRSQEFLCIRIERLAWSSDDAQVLETVIDVCYAIALDQQLSDRDDYLKHCIEMLGPRLCCGDKLPVLAPALDAMNKAWDLLGVFQALEQLPHQPTPD